LSVPNSASIRCVDLWKVYGPNVDAAIAAARAGMDRGAIQQRHGCVVAVAGVSFSVAPGEVFCIMGLSGSGKSTVLRHVNRLIEPSAGQVFIGDLDINRISAAELRLMRATRVSTVFQNVALLPHRTVLGNVVYGLEIQGIGKARRAEVAREKLALVGLADWTDRYPDELSGGMQQRVGLARALAVDPEILLMDEPFSALDPLIRRQLQDEFLKLSKVMRKTTIFITHDLNEATRVGDRIAIMREGRLIQVGTPSDIVSRPIDSYVAAFVQDISPLQVVRADSVMRPLGAAEVPGDALRAGIDTTLAGLVDAAAGSNRPIAIVDGEGGTVGLVTREDILAYIAARAR